MTAVYKPAGKNRSDRKYSNHIAAMSCLPRKKKRATAPYLTELLRASVRSLESGHEGRRTLRRRHLDELIYKAAKILAKFFDVEKDFNLMLQVVHGYCDCFGCEHVQEFLNQSSDWVAKELMRSAQEYLSI